MTSNLLLIDTHLRDIDLIESSLTSETDFAEFDFDHETFESLKSKVTKPYSHIAIAQHNLGKPYCKIIDNMSMATVIDVENVDPTLETWSEFVDFLMWLKVERGVTTVDFLACNIWESENWKYIINTLKSKTGLLIRASVDVTGAGGNFILESDNVDTIGIYFTEQIVEYKYAFYYSPPAFFTKRSFNASIALDPSMGLGTITSDNLSTFFGKRDTATVANTNVGLATSVSNVVFVCSNERASAAILSTGGVVCWGLDTYGGNCSAVAASLTNVVKIVTSNSAFAALRADGNVYSWGTTDSYISINTARSNNVTPGSINLTGCADIFANYNGFAALKTNKTVVGWGNQATSYNLSTVLNTTKIFPCENHMIALSSDGYALLWGGGSHVKTTITQPILDVYGSGSSIYCLCKHATTQVQTIQNAAGAVQLTLASGVTIKEFIQMSGGNFGFYMTDNTAWVNYNSSITTYTNVASFVVNDYCVMFLRTDGTVTAVGDVRFGSNMANVPAGANSNIVSLYSTMTSMGALKSDGTFIYFGIISNYSFYYSVGPPVTSFQASYPNDYPYLSNIRNVYDSNNGYVFTYADGSIKRIGKYGTDFGPNASGLDAGTSSAYTLPALTNKNLHLYTFFTSAIAVQVTPYESILPASGITQNTPITITYASNNQNRIAYKTRTYGLYSGSTLLSTFTPSGESTFTMVFNDVSSPEYGVVEFTVKEVTSTPFTLFTFSSSYITYNPPVPSAPSALSTLSVGDKTAQIGFTASNTFGTTLIGYKYSLNNGSYLWANELVPPITISNLTNGTSYNVRLKALNATGLSPASDTSLNIVPSTVPATPVITSITPVSGGLNVALSEVSNNGSAITNYYYSLNAGSYALVANRQTGLINITGLTNGTGYTVAVKTENANGLSTASLTSPQFTPCAAPSALAAPSVSAGDRQITVTFVSPASNGSAITYYSYKLYIDGSASSYIVAPIQGNATSFILTGLTNGSSYTVKMTATNVMGTSAESSLSSAAVPSALPAAPTITSVSVSDSAASIAFVAGSANGRTITGYKYSINGNATLYDASASSPISVSGLTNGTSYYFNIYAVTSIGTSPVSNTSSTVVPLKTPSAPTITGVTTSSDTASVAFTAGSINGPGSIIGYKYTLDGSNYAYAAGTASPLVIPDLTYGQQYTVQIVAVTSTNLTSAPSSASSAFTPYTVPSPPSVSAITASNGQLSVSVTDGSANGRPITSYKYSLNGGNYVSTANVTNPIVITGLTNGTSYTVRIKSVNLAGDSDALCAGAAAVPYAVQGAPTVTGTVAGNGYITVNVFDASLNGIDVNGYSITGYQYSLDSGATYSSTIAPVSSGSFVIPGVTNGQSYSFSVKSVSSLGVSAASAAHGPVVPVAAPAAPIMGAVVPSNYVADVYFTDGSGNGGSAVTKYKYSLNGGDEYIGLSTASPMRIYGLTNATSYTVRMKAVNAAGDSTLSESSTTFIPYGIPYAATITKILPGNGCVYVYFNAVDNNGSAIQGFRYSIGATPIPVAGLTSPLTIPDLKNKTKYTISIYSYNTAGQSPISNSIEIVAGVPEAPVINSVIPGAKSLTVHFTPPNDNASAITQYMFGFGSSIAMLKGIGLVSPIVVTGLLNGNPYDIYLVAVNKNGNSTKSNQLGNRIPYDIPNKVVISAAVPSYNSILVSFAPAIANGSAVTKYKYALNADTSFIDMSGLVSPIAIYDVPNNVNNTVKMIAINAAGESIVSGPSKPVKYVYLPPSQIKVTALVAGFQSLTATFVAPAANGAPITGYKYSINGGAYISTTYAPPALVITGLENNVNYNIQVVAVNSAGESIPSAPLSKPAQYVYLPPLAPVINTVTTGNSNVTVVFVAPPIRNAAVTGYKYSLNGGSTYTTYVADGSANVNSMYIDGLTNDMSYNFMMRATSGAGDGLPSPSRIFTPVYKAPDAPVIGTVITLTNQLVVNFPAPSANGSPITGYEYTFDNGVTVASSNLATSPITISGLVSKQSYSIKVRAINALGNSAWSVAKVGVPK